MSDSAGYALHRPEFLDALVRGEEKIAALTKGNDYRIRSGETLIEAGHEHQYVYRLLQGWTGRSRLLPDGRRQFILVFLPGDLFAVKSMFMNRHVDGVLALSDAHLERIHYRDLHDAYVKDGDIASRCIWQVMEEERRLHSWVTGLGQGSADERLALLLIDFRGRLISSKMIGADATSYEMPLTQSQLAEHIGTTAVHVNRVLKSFRETGVVTVRDGQVTIGNLPELARRASALLDYYERSNSDYIGNTERSPNER